MIEHPGKKALDGLVDVANSALDHERVSVTTPTIRAIAAYVATLEAEVEKLHASINAWCEQYDRVNIEKSTLEARAAAAEELVKRLEAEHTTRHAVAGPKAYDFVADWYAPSRCSQCGLRRDHYAHSRLARAALTGDKP